MTAGMPGAGLGGLLYIILALLMPVRELYLTVRGRSSAQRWRLVLQQLAIAVGIVASVLATALLVTRVLHAGSPYGVRGGGVLLAPVALAAGLLVVVVVTLRVWSFFAYPGSTRRAAGRTTSP